MSLYNIHITLVNPEGPLNIGAVTRAMKNFGFTSLDLVNPCDYINDDSYTMACGAKNLLHEAKAYNSIDAAIATSSLVIGFTRRSGIYRSPLIPFNEMVSKVLSQSENNQVSLLFGRERTGLTNDELDKCPVVCYLPTSNDYGSLNLAQAVLLVCYEISQSLCHSECSEESPLKNRDPQFVNNNEIEVAYSKLSELLFRIGFDDQDETRYHTKILKSFKRIFGRAGLERRDLDMILGVVKRVFKILDNK
ncbi:RNA methyltransferase [bacterium]|nr:RNA methyltransferase [bacterium]